MGKQGFYQIKLVLGYLCLCVFFNCQPNNTDHKNSLPSANIVINNVNVIDAKNGLQNGMTVLIKDNKIIKVERSTSILFSKKNTNVIDATGKYLIPGLWDTHVHLSYDKNLSPSTMFQLFLAYGVTSIRDTGGQLDLVLPERARARKDPKNFPRVMLSGPLLDGVPTVYDGKSKFNPHLGIGAGTVEEAEQLADEMIAADVDLLKAYEMLTPEAFKAILKKAQAKGIPVTGHVPLSMDVIEASDAGLRSMEHLRNLEFACSSDWEKLLEARQKMLFDGKKEVGSVLRRFIHNAQRMHAIENHDVDRRKEVLKHLADNETWQVPTLCIATVASELFFVRPDWHDSFKYLPDTVKNRWIDRSLAFAENRVKENTRIYADWIFEMIGHLKEANVDMMAGTDCPIFFLTPGYSLHEELALLVKGGLTPLEAIEAATTKPAEYFNLEKELGLVQEGMLADLLILNANPLEDIRNTTKIHGVIKDGKLHNQKAIDELLSSLEKR